MPRHYSYLKISECCNNNCTFYIIPDIRGKLKSSNISNVMIDDEKPKNAGVKELLVISQDTSTYSVDINMILVFSKRKSIKVKYLGFIGSFW